MNALIPVEQSDLVLTHIDTLCLSPMNPRQTVTKEEIETLAESISTCGLIQNLSGILDGEGRVGIVAGGRRLRAIARAVERDATVTERHPELASIPVRIASDEATARAWASAENAAREARKQFGTCRVCARNAGTPKARALAKQP